MHRGVEVFGGGAARGNDLGPELLGRKGGQLAELAGIGLPIPPGFIVTTEICNHFVSTGSFPDTFREEVLRAISHVEASTGKAFGAASNPLLLSIRTSSPVPMLDIFGGVLNIGLNGEAVDALAAMGGSPTFAWDSYRRLIHGYAGSVLNLELSAFEEALEVLKEDRGVSVDTDLDALDWKRLADEYLELVRRQSGREFPNDRFEQLWSAIAAAFASTRSEHVRVYRRLNNIPDDAPIAVIVQAMVFGNLDDTSATGVAFTRNPSTGDPSYYGEYLIKALGEDVVAGIRTPQYLTKAARIDAGAKPQSMEEALPKPFGDLTRMFALLESHFRDMVDVEFCIERGRSWILAASPGRRTARAAIRIAVDLAHQGIISERDAVSRVKASFLRAQLVDRMDDDAAMHPLAQGLPASPGAASGMIVFDADTAEREAAEGNSVILVCVEVSPEDLHGMHASKGILTCRGGMTGHAAVVARGMDRPCVSGAGMISIDRTAGLMRVGDKVLREGDIITIDGASGLVAEGDVIHSTLAISPEACSLIDMADRLNGACGALAVGVNEAVVAQALQRSDIYTTSAGGPAQTHRGARMPGPNSSWMGPRQGEPSMGLQDRIAEITRAVRAPQLTVIVEAGHRDPDKPGTLPDRSRHQGIALNPISFHETLSEICAGFTAGAADDRNTRFRVAIPGVVHANDISTCRTMLNEIAGKTSLNVELIGVIDSPYSLLFCDRLFAGVTTLLLDMQQIGENLFLQSPEGLATYQDLGEIDVPASKGGVFGDVLTLLRTSPLKSWKDRCAGDLSAILPSPCGDDVWHSLQHCGVSSLIFPVRLLPEALTSVLTKAG
jgi:phosphohistidine swiveling domain-containing protein